MAVMGRLKQLLAVRTSKDADAGAVEPSAQVSAVVAAWSDNLKTLDLEHGGSMSLGVSADSDGDADFGDKTALYWVSDQYACWYILAEGVKASVIAFWSYVYDGWADEEMLCCSEDIGEAVEKSAGYIASKQEAEAALLDWLERKGRPETPSYRVAKQEAAQRYTLGVAYPVDEVDSHGDWMEATDLEKAAWAFLQSGNAILKGAGTDHEDGTDLSGTPVESYIYRGPDWTGDDGELIAKTGDWMLGVVWTDEAWERIEKGELTGYSLQGLAYVDEGADAPAEA